MEREIATGMERGKRTGLIREEGGGEGAGGERSG
jgi:hypothetical protein